MGSAVLQRRNFPNGNLGTEAESILLLLYQTWSISLLLQRKEKSWKVMNLKCSSLVSCYTLTWKIPWTEEPGRLQSMESQRVRHD